MTGLLTLLGLCAVCFTVSVTGISFTISRERVLLGSTGTLTLTCDITETDVETIYNIQIKQLKSTTLSGDNDADWQRLAYMKLSANENPTLDSNITPGDKDYVAGGSWNSETPASTDLTLSMNMEKLTCDDARTYRCELSYENSQQATATVFSNATFTAYVKPQVTSLVVRKNGFIVEGMSPSNMATAAVGDELQLTCTANIGSIPGTIIRWHRTSETSQNDDFIGYQAPQGTYDEGTAISDNQCGYTRVASIRYNTTAADANRDNNLAFDCYVTVTGDPYGNSYTSENNPRFYTDVTGSGGGGNTGENVGTAGGSDTAAIVGGVVGGLVLIVLIVLLVYFLWYRRRNSGEDYTTKEEYGSSNPNIAPDTYATVDKTTKKRGHENRGLDEPHESRRHYQNTHGKANYGMDREADDYDDYDDDRDGSPNPHSINHMGIESHGGIGTGV
ncbi:uncharacterized protein LOC132741494 isoform X3 [Ruditapes philippinarum]|uniref:uncharacterized protein LOC132741494 isoform X3 n=1 Tax=Ruditapes philippinarum TaxID=129788 RepID=UPI00295AEF96|nr:uncharacterized protein LOC132741494 isoform X3 [Ruditapes philippinarum]